jgi:hypothetical protein
VRGGYNGEAVDITNVKFKKIAFDSDLSALNNKTSTINSVGVLPSGQTYCKIAEWQDSGGAWALTSLLCEIQGANDTNEREPTRIYCRVERGGTANDNLNVNMFVVNGYSIIQCYVQKESDNYVRWYVSNYTSNTSCHITYYNQYDASCAPAIAGMASLPNAGGSNGALARATGAKTRTIALNEMDDTWTESGTASVSGNTLVRRTPNGYVYAGYFQQSSGEETPGNSGEPGGIAFYNSQASDRYWRKWSWAGFVAKLKEKFFTYSNGVLTINS